MSEGPNITDKEALLRLERMMEGLQDGGEVYKAYCAFDKTFPRLRIPSSSKTEKNNDSGKYMLTLTCGCPNPGENDGASNGSCQWKGAEEEGATFVGGSINADKSNITCYSASVGLTKGVTIGSTQGQKKLNLVWTRGLSGEDATKNISSKKIARLNRSEGSKKFLNKDLSTAGATESINGAEASLTIVSAGATGVSISITGFDANVTGAILRFRGFYKSSAAKTVCFTGAESALASIKDVLSVSKVRSACAASNNSMVVLR